MHKILKRVRSKALLVAALAASATIGLAASASPPTMPAIPLPVDGPSVVSSIVGLGVTVLLLAMAAIIGFRLARKLMTRVSGAV